MKREDVKSHIPGITEEQLNWLMTCLLYTSDAADE